MGLPVPARNRRGERVLRMRTGQAGDQLVNVILVIVIAAAIGLIGTDVNAEIDDSVDIGLEGEDFTVNNESFTVDFTATSADNFNYTVDKASDADSFDDDEIVVNSTGAVATESTDYEWFTSNGTLRIENTTHWDDGETGNITYNGTDKTEDFAHAKNNISGGYADAMGLSDIVFIVLMFGVILSVLLAFRMRT